jgi:hypothetical protein
MCSSVFPPCSFLLYLIHPPVLLPLTMFFIRHTHPSILRQAQYSPATCTSISPTAKYRSQSECLCMCARCVRTWCVRQNDRSSVATRYSYFQCSISLRQPHRRSSLRHKNITVALPDGFILVVFVTCVSLSLQDVLLGSSFFQACLSVRHRETVHFICH